MKIIVTKSWPISPKKINRKFPTIKSEYTDLQKWEDIQLLKPRVLLLHNQDCVDIVPPLDNAIAIITFFPYEFMDWLPDNLSENYLYTKLEHTIQNQNLYQELTTLCNLAVLGEATSDMIHTINNPLQVMLGFTEDIIDTMPDANEHKKDLRLIEQEIHRCSEILSNINILRNQTQSNQDLHILLENLLALLQVKRRRKKLSFKMTVPSGINSVARQYSNLKIVLLNVLSAAVKNAKEESNIEIAAEDETEVVKILISIRPINNKLSTLSLQNYLKQLDIFFDCYPDSSLFVYVLKLKK